MIDCVKKAKHLLGFYAFMLLCLCHTELDSASKFKIAAQGRNDSDRKVITTIILNEAKNPVFVEWCKLRLPSVFDGCLVCK